MISKCFLDLPTTSQTDLSYCNSHQFANIKFAHRKFKSNDFEFEKECISYSGVPLVINSDHVHVTVEHVVLGTHWRGWFEKFDRTNKLYLIVCNDGLGYSNPPFDVFIRYLFIYFVCINFILINFFFLFIYLSQEISSYEVYYNRL